MFICQSEQIQNDRALQKEVKRMGSHFSLSEMFDLMVTITLVSFAGIITAAVIHRIIT